MAKERVAGGGGGLFPPTDNTEHLHMDVPVGSPDTWTTTATCLSPTRELLEALAESQVEFPTVVADKEVRAGSYKYSYSPLEDIIKAVRPVLSKHGLLVTWETSVTFEGGAMVVNVATILWHPASGGSLRCDLGHVTSGTNVQDLGKICSYLRRYSAVCVIGLVVASEDDDAASVGQKSARNGKAVVTITEEQSYELLALMSDADVDPAKVKVRYGLKPDDDIAKLPAALFVRAKAALRTTIAKKGSA